MRILAWTAAVGLVTALVACGGSESGNTGGAGGTGGNLSSSSSTAVSTSSSSSTAVSTSSSSSSSSSSSGGMTGCGSSVFSPDKTCQSCVEQNCCAELLACDTGTACNDLLVCLHGCTDMACEDDCLQKYPGGMPSFSSLFTCALGPGDADGACNTQCADGAICDSGLVDLNNKPCGSCAGEKCCGEYTACANDQPCLDCFTGKTDATVCKVNALFQAARSCQIYECGAICNGTICDSNVMVTSVKCATCLGTKCCDVIKACESDTHCFNKCLYTTTPAASCATDAKFQAAKTCWNTGCSGVNDCNSML